MTNSTISFSRNIWEILSKLYGLHRKYELCQNKLNPMRKRISRFFYSWELDNCFWLLQTKSHLILKSKLKDFYYYRINSPVFFLSCIFRKIPFFIARYLVNGPLCLLLPIFGLLYTTLGSQLSLHIGIFVTAIFRQSGRS